MKIRGIIAAAAALTFAVTALASCGGSESSSSAESRAETSASENTAESSAESTADSSEPEKLPETDEEWHEAMIKKSLVTVGDTTAMQAKIKKAQSGEKVTVAYIGGSITEGMTAGSERCYAKLSYNSFKEKYGKDGGSNVEYVNAGISGTPSKLGNLRLERDVLSHSPDICFIEFAVNDGGGEDYQAAYESIVRDLLEKDVAVVLLFAVTESGHSSQDYMKTIGEYYGLPMISYCDALRFMFDNNKMTWKDFSDDSSHPNVSGHALVAEMIDYYYDNAEKTAAQPHAYPAEPLSVMVHQGMKLFGNADAEPVSLGSWVEGSTISYFTDGWTYEPDTGNEPIVFKFKGKFAYMVYKEVKAGNFGKLHIRVTCDGKLYDERDISAVTKDGWGNPQTALLGMQAAETEYTVEISMAEGCESMNGELLAIAHN